MLSLDSPPMELSRVEGIIPALESSHALALGKKIAQNYKPDDILVVNISGNGGKDLDILQQRLRFDL